MEDDVLSGASEDYQNVDESIVGTLQDGRTIVRSKDCTVIRDNILTYYIQINFTRLNIIDAILDLQVRSTTPPSNIASLTQKKITRHATLGHPVVGLTVFGVPSGITGTGTTVCTECVAIGW